LTKKTGAHFFFSSAGEEMREAGQKLPPAIKNSSPARGRIKAACHGSQIEEKQVAIIAGYRDEEKAEAEQKGRSQQPRHRQVGGIAPAPEQQHQEADGQ
jgi:hypothetical protein